MLTKSDLVDALGCFWNAAIGESHNRQEGMAFAAIMAEGIQAIANRLNELDQTTEYPYTPNLGDGTPDAALAIGEHAFRAGWEAGAIYADYASTSAIIQTQTEEEAVAKAWSDYTPPEDIKALS